VTEKADRVDHSMEQNEVMHTGVRQEMHQKVAKNLVDKDYDQGANQRPNRTKLANASHQIV